MRSSLPLAVTSTPVRCGRVSSREAARATRPIMSTKAPAGTVKPPSAGASGSFGKSSAGSVRRWNFAGPETTSTSCCELRYSSVRSSFGRERTTSSSRRPGTTAWPPLDSSARDGYADTELHVGRLELGVAVLDPDEHSGERLDGASRGSASHGDAQSGQERFTGNGELQMELPISDLGVVGVVRMLIARRGPASQAGFACEPSC